MEKIPIYILKSFLFNAAEFSISELGNGLINSTYQISNFKQTIVLQKINSKVFTSPKIVIDNYISIFNFLQQREIPTPLLSNKQLYFTIDEQGDFWRAFEFINFSTTINLIENKDQAFSAAYSFGNFTKALSNFPFSEIKDTIPKFHDLSLRFDEFEIAIENASTIRKKNSDLIIIELKNRKSLIHFFETFSKNKAFKKRLMHHDAKLSNLLFDSRTNKVITPIDLDTTQAGYYFSDLGDLIRTLTCTESESSIKFNSIDINSQYYDSLVAGYLEAMGNELSQLELKNIHYAGLLIIYMQAMRFLTDYLNDDIYYRTTYPNQNWDRAKNQLILLQKLEFYLFSTNKINDYLSTSALK